MLPALRPDDPTMEGPVETDPVCGMAVNPATAAGSHEYRGTTYYFCSTGCLQDFRDDPDAYVR